MAFTDFVIIVKNESPDPLKSQTWFSMTFIWVGEAKHVDALGPPRDTTAGHIGTRPFGGQSRARKPNQNSTTCNYE